MKKYESFKTLRMENDLRKDLQKICDLKKMSESAYIRQTLKKSLSTTLNALTILR